MSTGALLFLALSWSFVLGLAGWAFAKVLRKPDAPAPPPPRRKRRRRSGR